MIYINNMVIDTTKVVFIIEDDNKHPFKSRIRFDNGSELLSDMTVQELATAMDLTFKDKV